MIKTEEKLYSIGEIAKIADVSHKTLRHYIVRISETAKF